MYKLYEKNHPVDFDWLYLSSYFSTLYAKETTGKEQKTIVFVYCLYLPLLGKHGTNIQYTY